MLISSRVYNIGDLSYNPIGALNRMGNGTDLSYLQKRRISGPYLRDK